jgi:hypothetical protein
MHSQADRQAHPLCLRQAGIELAQGLDHPQPGPHCALRVIFVCLRIAKIDQQPIAEVLCDVPLIARDHPGTGRLIGLHDLTEVFRVELAGKCSRVHQVTKQHGELAPFGVGGSCAGRCGCAPLVQSAVGAFLMRRCEGR